MTISMNSLLRGASTNELRSTIPLGHKGEEEERNPKTSPDHAASICIAAVRGQQGEQSPRGISGS